MLLGTTEETARTVEPSLQIHHSETGQVETLPYQASEALFSNDGHWLLVNPTDEQTLIRAIDAPSGEFQPFSDELVDASRWSSDGRLVLAVSGKASQPTTVSLFTSPEGVWLGAWQADGYKLFPNGSPDGKYLAAWGRLFSDLNQSALFAVQIPDAAQSVP